MLPACRPARVYELRVEVTERTRHHNRLHITEDATSANGVEGEGIEAERLTLGGGLRGEVVDPSEVVDAGARVVEELSD